MTDKPNDSHADAGMHEKVQELTWSLLDEQITADEMSLLDGLLMNDEKARATYIGCVQLHADLATHFTANRAPANAASTKSPILGFLNAAMPPLGLQSQPTDDANT